MCDAADGMKVHDLFVTDIEYDADETVLGQVMTGPQATPLATNLISCAVPVYVASSTGTSIFADVKMGSIVRFVSKTTSTVPDFCFVREVLVSDFNDFQIRIDTPLLLPFADEFYMQLVREWIPRPLALNNRFKLITACEVKAYSFCGLSSANLYEGE
mmetsp:Transcript_37853/g.87416  ORF Transcript_37853/g.87416 Transcript_37853/m.87416 type:complete len:158 (-) Transcript_37853:961-1434(-)